MILLAPWSLLVLPVIVLAAVWALYRPVRQLALVASLELWKRAIERLDRSVLSRSKRISIAWWCLLIGAVFAGLALARPAWRAAPPARQVAVAIIPSAELGTSDAMRLEVDRFLARLAGNDRVQLLLPDVLPSRAGWLSPPEAKAEVDKLPILPAKADDLRLHPAAGAVQHTYIFAPGGASLAAGPNETLIPLPAHPPDVTIDAIGASEVSTGPGTSPATAPATVQVFVALKNQTAQPLRAALVLSGFDDLGQKAELVRQDIDLPPQGRVPIVLKPRLMESYEVNVSSGGAGPPAGAYLAREKKSPVKVALVGPEEPLVRRFVQVNPALTLVDPKDAQLVITNRLAPPAGLPAIVINPRELPPGWSRGDALKDVSLAKAQVSAGDPLLAGVELSGVAHVVEPWIKGDSAEGDILASVGPDALIIEQRQGRDGERPRIYVAFDMSAANCTWSMTPSFVVFLANAIERLVPDAQGAAGAYGFRRPIDAGDWRQWKHFGDAGKKGDWPLPEPGLYLDEHSQFSRLTAVSLVGLASSQAPASGPAGADVALCEPAPVGRDREFWPMLSLLAAACWLAGWFLRSRE